MFKNIPIEVPPRGRERVETTTETARETDKRKRESSGTRNARDVSA